MWLICGLGNPGKRYLYTRHNIGFEIVDLIINKYNFILKNKDKNQELYKGVIQNNNCLICKPLTFMNNSGIVISKTINYYKIKKTKIIVIHDDLDLTLGKIKIKVGGGNAGHNGLSSIDNVIGNQYKRIRFGIGHPGSKNLVEKYVLNKFDTTEKEIVNKQVENIIKYFSLIFENKSLFLTKILS